ncbi:permease [Halarchaeum sp. P4]|uniref:permease n=1 Tax=Halarchaeum sp. P4 TaxID=3421639 RepID=UPI003EBE133D
MVLQQIQLLQQLESAVTLFFGMAWDTWWTLVLGFTITGAVETFVSEERMSEVLGGDDWEDVGVGTVLGAASSSCSFAATSTAKSLFKKGASAESSIAAYQFAATDLVAELFLVMWALLGWQFVAAEIFGGILAVGVIAYLWKNVVPQSWFDAAREHLMSLEDVQCAACGMSADPEDADTTEWTDPRSGTTKYFCCGGCLNAYKHMDRNPDEEIGWQEHATSLKGWKDASRNTMKEWDMLWDDIAIGFVIASLLGAFVPTTWWATLFPAGESIVAVTVSATIGVIIGIVTFLCSVGNIPFALVLWSNGVPFGALMSFIYGDMLIPPLLRTYRRYYGTRMMFVILLTYGFAAIVAGVFVHYLFAAAGAIPASGTVGGTLSSDYTGILNIIAFAVFGAQVYVAYGPEKMQEDLEAAPALAAAGLADAKRAGRITADAFSILATAVTEALRLLSAAGSHLLSGLRTLNDGLSLVTTGLVELWAAFKTVTEAIGRFLRRLGDAARVFRD